MRTIGIPQCAYIKPELMFRHKEDITEAKWVLFPEYWQVNALVYALNARIFPSIQSFHLGHDKIEMTRVLQMLCPENVPYTQILANTESNIEVILEEFSFPFIAKEVRNSMGRGVHLIESKQQFYDYVNSNDVLYAQEYLPIDRDLRIAYVGDEVIGSYWRIGQDNHYLNNVSQGGTISFDNIPFEAVQLVERVARALNINHAGFDVAVVNDRLYFFEFNILFGNVAFQQANISIEQKIWEYLLKHDSTRTPPFKPFTPAPSRAS